SEICSLMIENAHIYLSGLSKCCDNLHIAFADRIFSDAESACNSLLTILKKNKKDGRSESEELISQFAKDVAKRRKNLYGRAEAIAIISDMVRKLAPYGIAPEVSLVADAKSMSFMSLDRIIRNVEVL
ncbi:MAG: metallophosphoesterase, partial [Hydrogenophaga sp.]|nr:metallophosphoesterase [Hydrogenophaga sp.]